MSAHAKANNEYVDACIAVIEDPSSIEGLPLSCTPVEAIATTIGVHYSGGTDDGAIEELTNEVAILREVVAALILKLCESTLTKDDLKSVLSGDSY